MIAQCHLLKVVEWTRENLRITWLHCNTFDPIMSAVMKGFQKRFEKDIGTNDFEAFNKIPVEWTEVQMNNANTATVCGG